MKKKLRSRIEKNPRKPMGRTRNKLATLAVLFSGLLPLSSCDSHIQLYVEQGCDCSCSGKDGGSSDVFTEPEISSCNPNSLASGRIGIGGELEVKNGALGLLVRLVSIDLDNYEVTVDILSLGKKPIEKGVKIPIGEETKEIVQLVSRISKLVTIGVCEEGTDSKGANVWATF